MGKPHTIIGAEQFHFRVRDGIGWDLLAIATRQTGLKSEAMKTIPGLIRDPVSIKLKAYRTLRA